MDGKKIKFIELHEDIVINGTSIPAYTRLPVLIDGKQEFKDGTDIDKNSIVSGMMEVLKGDYQRENTGYYRDILLADTLLLERLKTASKVKGASREFGDAMLNIDIISSVCALELSELSYINYVRAILNAINLCEYEQDHDSLQELLGKVLQKGLKQFPDSYSLLFHLADYHRNQHNFEVARKCLDQLYSHSYDNESVDRLKQSIDADEEEEKDTLYIFDMICMNDADKAIEKSNEFLGKHPHNWYVLMLLGWAYRLKGKNEEAEKALIDSIKYGGGDYAETYNELALATWALGKKVLAETYEETACDLDEANVSYSCNCALMNIELQDYETAHKFLFQAAESDETDEVLLDVIKLYNRDSGDIFEMPSVLKKRLRDSQKPANGKPAGGEGKTGKGEDGRILCPDGTDL